MSSIAPTDVPPASNLPGPSVAWGRNRDDHILELEKKIITLQQAQAGSNRGTAASLASLGDAIASVIVTDYGLGDATNFNLPTVTPATVASVSIPVPAGYTTALVTMMGYVYARNFSGASDYLYGRAWIDGIYATVGRYAYPITPTGERTDILTSRVAQVPVTPGVDIVLTMTAHSVGATPWYPTATSYAFIQGTVLFTR